MKLALVSDLHGQSYTLDYLEKIIKKERPDGIVISGDITAGKDLSFFEKAGIRPAQDYMGRHVRVFGLIKLYRGSPEIIASHPGQIEVLE